MAIPLKYNYRSLVVRRIGTLMTVLSIALVIFIFISIMALANGLETVLVSSGDPLNVLVRRHGSDSELSSSVSREALQSIKYLPGIRLDADNNPLVSPEIIISINLPRRGQEQGSNITIRGLSQTGLLLRPQIRLLEGRMFQPGLREVIVSHAIANRFQSTGLGERLQFGKGDWQVVGIFDAGGTVYDSEIWTNVEQLASDYNRQSYSTVLLAAADSSAVQAIVGRIEGDQQHKLMAQTEREYFEKQTQAAGAIKTLAMFIAIVMGIGVCFAAMNTMYSAVSYRTQEIATLRVLGFKRRSILFSFMIEALMLTLVGGVIGSIMALPIHGVTTGTVSWQTASEVAFAFRITPQLIVSGLVFAVLMGLFGGFFPARQAARQSPAAMLR